MKAVAFFHTDDVRRVIDRAARAAAMPVSVHFVGGGEEGACPVSAGRCGACAYVAGRPGGPAACRASRLPAATTALRRNAPVAFLCHMGFGCVAAPALPGVDAAFALTLGPYCPAEAPQTLSRDFRAGLAALDEAGESPEDAEMPSLSDIPLAVSQAVPVLAAWASDELGRLWRAVEQAAPGSEMEVDDLGPGPRSGRRTRRTGLAEDPYRAHAIAAALAANKQAEAGALFRSALRETAARGGPAGCARTIAVAAAALEAGHHQLDEDGEAEGEQHAETGRQQRLLVER
ncbi:MAG: PocR ligand-binding domain-containing protein, partial [Candidatus Hydrogenedentes bacterium]|nr:PocR ligand-binding domain-containing protein [Candidatus Hydrogenedentota bacterium]